MPIFPYGQAEIDHLTRRDRKLGAAIARIGPIERHLTPDPFAALLSSIVAQQISSKAAATVWNRLSDRYPITPLGLADATAEDIQGCGMSMRKAGYIRGIVDAVLSGAVDPARFPEMSDAEIIRQLVGLRGVGVWTAEMLLLFSLGRKDIVSYDDLAIRRGMMRLYGLEKLDRKTFARIRARYSPYGSVASLYLWALSVDDPDEAVGIPFRDRVSASCVKT